MDWPTGQDVNRQARALLSVLLLGVVALVSWRSCSTLPDRQNGGEIVISDAQTRGGVLRSSLRSEPRTFTKRSPQVVLTAPVGNAQTTGTAPLRWQPLANAASYDVEMPLTDAVNRVCHKGLSVDEAVVLLLGRSTKPE